MLEDDLAKIKKAYSLYLRDPQYTPKKKLKMMNHKNLFIIEQNPEKDSPYARLKNAGLEIAHIINNDAEIFWAFSIKKNLYIKTDLLNKHLDGSLLRRELTPYFEDMDTREIAGVKIEYCPDEDGKARVVRLNENNLHVGFRLDLIEERFT